MLVDPKSRMVVDLFVCLPSEAEWICRTYSRRFGRLLALRDFHVDQRAAQTAEQREGIARHAEDILRGWTLIGELIPSFLHARRYALRAGVQGTTWGTELDFSLELPGARKTTSTGMRTANADARPEGRVDSRS